MYVIENWVNATASAKGTQHKLGGGTDNTRMTQMNCARLHYLGTFASGHTTIRRVRHISPWWLTNVPESPSTNTILGKIPGEAHIQYRPHFFSSIFVPLFRPSGNSTQWSFPIDNACAFLHVFSSHAYYKLLDPPSFFPSCLKIPPD